jgi:hypothetical protein
MAENPIRRTTGKGGNYRKTGHQQKHVTILTHESVKLEEDGNVKKEKNKKSYKRFAESI